MKDDGTAWTQLIPVANRANKASRGNDPDKLLDIRWDLVQAIGYRKKKAVLSQRCPRDAQSNNTHIV